jgi:hypothetical protein
MAPVTPKLERVSWSQVESFGMCERRWYFRWHRPDIKEETSDALDLGTEIHSVIEKHYDPRLPQPILKFPDHVAHKSVAKLLADPKMPPVDGEIRLEYPQDYEMGIKAAGVPVRGRMDLLWAKNRHHLVIDDHKTTKHWKYAKTADDLERFGQPIMYARWAFETFPHLEQVSLMHSIVLTSAVGARVVETQPLDRRHIDEQYAPIEATVERMVKVYEVANPLDVKPNAQSCRKFGRACPYVSICPDGQSIGAGWEEESDAATVAIQGEASMSLKEKLAARGATTTDAPKVRATGINPPDAAKPKPVEKYVPPPPATSDATPAPTPGETTSTVSGLVLILDSLIQKGFSNDKIQYLDDLIAERAAPIARAGNVADVREIPYGQGVVDLVASFRRSPPTGVVVASLHDRLSGEVVGVLVPVASTIIRGTK